MKRGLVLEGGGAKGAYHAGAVKALYDNGYSFDGIAGTSIGAVNGAMIAQDDNCDVCLDMWTNVQMSDIVDMESSEAGRLFCTQPDSQSIKYWIERAIAIIKNFGVPTDKIIPFLKKYIDEDKIRLSGRDFAIVTVCITDKKPLELHLEDIPYGELCNYIFASAYFPIFKMSRINGKYYIDGGIYDNLPINALIRKDSYDEIVAVRTGNKKIRPIIDNTVNVRVIQPYESLGKTTELDREKVLFNIKLGYYDSLKMINNYKGFKYYLDNTEYSQFDDLLHSLSNSAIEEIANLYKLKKSASREDVINTIYHNCKKNQVSFTNEQSFLIFLEKYALILELERFVIYSFDKFIGNLKELCYNTNKLEDLEKNDIKVIRYNKLFKIIMNDIKIDKNRVEVL